MTATPNNQYSLSSKSTINTSCLFCRIAKKEIDSVVIYEDADLMAFLDIYPIRPAHTQIITKIHIPSFELLPHELAGQIMRLGQNLAQQMKAVYKVDRAAFLFTGGDVAHVHAHVVPLHEKTDITSARYIVDAGNLQWRSKHLEVGLPELCQVRNELGFKSI